MAENPNEFGSDGADLDSIKRMRRSHPSGWLELSMDPARALLIDSILDAPPGYEFTAREISQRAGITAQSVRNHIDVLIRRGVVEKSNGSRYKVVDNSRVLIELEHLNSAVTAIRAGMASDEIGDVDPANLMDNSKRGQTESNQIMGGEGSPPGIINAD